MHPIINQDINNPNPYIANNGNGAKRPIDINKIFGVVGIIVFGILFIRTEGTKK